jgi:NAD(P)-dependent dehydrogenase (short-subunit alcohol dehydrogenase family)
MDILVNSAGGSQPAPFLELTDEQLVGGWTLKLLSAIRLTRAVVPIMEARGGGSVVSIGGGTANFSPDRVTAATTISAMRGFTKAVAPDLAKRGISVNIIHPGSVSTGRQRMLAGYTAGRRGVSVEQVIEEQAAAVPTGHVTTPEEVADLALFRTSRSIFNLTGAEVILDGGVSRAL